MNKTESSEHILESEIDDTLNDTEEIARKQQFKRGRGKVYEHYCDFDSFEEISVKIKNRQQQNETNASNEPPKDVESDGEIESDAVSQSSKRIRVDETKEYCPLIFQLIANRRYAKNMSLIYIIVFFDNTINIDKKFINWSKLYLIHDIWNYTRGSIFYNRIDL
ncbi:hypothetical protein BpHYR1_010211 [Brachionus plicatilis]|uniref:Uncharacterized protein n=1 Tax=Brachionus plicatilis TaxID=10195 RepID=A0A3M7PD52_BRAPC|nr:hypothetical protein BpHYR1_010211 [Brachionus plicatilis]